MHEMKDYRAAAQAIQIAFETPGVYSHQTAAQILNTLIDMEPLPILLMRTLLQVWGTWGLGEGVCRSPPPPLFLSFFPFPPCPVGGWETFRHQRILRGNFCKSGGETFPGQILAEQFHTWPQLQGLCLLRKAKRAYERA